MQKQTIFSMNSDNYPFGQITVGPTSPPSLYPQISSISKKTLVKKVFVFSSSGQAHDFLSKVIHFKNLHIRHLIKLQSVLSLQDGNQVHLLFEYVPFSFIAHLNQNNSNFSMNLVISTLRQLIIDLITHKFVPSKWEVWNFGLGSNNEVKYYPNFNTLKSGAEVLDPESKTNDQLTKIIYELKPYLSNTHFLKISQDEQKTAKVNSQLLSVKPITEFKLSSSIPSNSSNTPSQKISCLDQFPMTKLGVLHQQGKLRDNYHPKNHLIDRSYIFNDLQEPKKESSPRKNLNGKYVIRGNWDVNNFFALPSEDNDNQYGITVKSPVSHIDKSTTDLCLNEEDISNEEIIWQKMKASQSLMGEIELRQSVNLLRNKAQQAIERSRKAMQTFRSAKKYRK